HTQPNQIYTLSLHDALPISQPCRCEPVMRPRVYVRPEGIAKIKTSWTKFERGVGFSKGWALLAPKNPPPFVPNSLMTSCEATGRSEEHTSELQSRRDLVCRL